jgi:hypothetical protein
MQKIVTPNRQEHEQPEMVSLNEYAFDYWSRQLKKIKGNDHHEMYELRCQAG